MSAPHSIGPAEVRRGEGVVDRPAGCRWRGRSRRWPRCRARWRWGCRSSRRRARAFGRDRLGEVPRVVRIDERDVDAELLEGVLELGEGAAVERPRRDDVVAGHQHRHQRHELGGLPGGGRDGAGPAFERRHPLLEGGGGRVHDPGVDVAVLLQLEQVGGVVRALEDEGGGLVDRHGPGAGVRVRPLAGVDGAGVEAELARAGRLGGRSGRWSCCSLAGAGRSGRAARAWVCSPFHASLMTVPGTAFVRSAAAPGPHPQPNERGGADVPDQA